MRTVAPGKAESAAQASANPVTEVSEPVLVGINAQKLFVTQDYRNAGVSRYIRQLVRHLPLVPGDERYRLYTNRHVTSWPEVEGARLSLAPTRLPTLSPVLRILWEQTVLPALARRDRLDLLHCPLNVSPAATHVPVVLTIHDVTFLHYPDRFSRLKQRYLATFTRFSARRAARILADSAATKEDVHRAFGIPRQRIDVVYPGVDEDFRPLDPANPEDVARLESFRRRYGLPERVVLYQGTLEPRKNVDQLVRAFALAVRRGLPHTLVLAGGKGWGYEAIFRAVEESGVRQRIRFAGYVPREEQPLWYNAAQLFVYPSQYEGFGLPPLEAMACGVPVITSNTSSLPEVVGEAGIMVDPADVEALAEAMMAVATNEARRVWLSAAGRERALRFGWPAAAAEAVAGYRRALAAAAAPAFQSEPAGTSDPSGGRKMGVGV